MNSKEKIEHLQDLLELERQEDLRQYKEKVLKRTLKERIQKGVTWFPVFLRRMYFGLGDRLVIEVERSESKKKVDSGFQSGAVVAVFGMDMDQMSGRLTGVIAALQKNSMKIALSTDNIPDWLPHSKLGIDLEFDDKTYQEMKRALVEIKEPKKNERLKELREVLFGERKPEFHDWSIQLEHPQLNPSQNKAVQRALEAKDVAIIHGPPGTGKTTTMVHTIQEVLLHEHQVMICAASNTAVDLLTLKCIELGMDVVRLGNPARVDEELLKHTLDGAVANHPDYNALKKLRKDVEDARKRAHKFKRKYGSREYHKRKELLRDAREMKALAHQLEDYILHQVINRTPIIACTLTGASSKVLGRKSFHTVFIDEAGQALTPASCIPLLRCNRVIMAGDHLQLPPTVKSMEAEKKGLSTTLFEEVVEKHPETSVMLEQQYRMNEQIMRFSGLQFYENRLIADASVKDHQLTENFPPVAFIDTAGCGFNEKKNPETLSTGNPDEAQLLLRHLALMFMKLESEAPDTLNASFSVGVIAPYKQQVQILKQQLGSSPMLSSFKQYITINTVDGFQGQERDVIYISLVRSNKRGEIGFLQDIRRMNVALTRARKRLVVIGDSATLGSHHFYEDFFNYIDKIGAYHSAWELMETLS
ncbi:MAG: AAA domain-containing protein [Bacteroidota bacterium]